MKGNDDYEMDGLMGSLRCAGFNTDQLDLADAMSYPMFVSKMCREISLLLTTEETVHFDNDDQSSWKMELSSLLKVLFHLT